MKGARVVTDSRSSIAGACLYRYAGPDVRYETAPGGAVDWPANGAFLVADLSITSERLDGVQSRGPRWTLANTLWVAMAINAAACLKMPIYHGEKAQRSASACDGRVWFVDQAPVVAEKYDLFHCNALDGKKRL